jgi:transposase-like protein
VRPDQSFKGRQFTTEVILWAVRWYLMFPVSYRDLEPMLADRGVEVAHTTVFRWVRTYAPEIEKRIRPYLRLSNGLCRVDETYVRLKGRRMYLYRAVDSRGQTVDFLLSAKRDAEAAKRFFRKALGQLHTVNPRTITVDKNPAYPCATAELKADDELWCLARLRQCKFLNNIVEQDHRRVKRLIRPGLGFGSFHTARRTLTGYEAMAMIRKGQVRKVGGRDMQAQATFVAELFEVAAWSGACHGDLRLAANFATQPLKPPSCPQVKDWQRYVSPQPAGRILETEAVRVTGLAGAQLDARQRNLGPSLLIWSINRPGC